MASSFCSRARRLPAWNTSTPPHGHHHHKAPRTRMHQLHFMPHRRAPCLTSAMFAQLCIGPLGANPPRLLPVFSGSYAHTTTPHPIIFAERNCRAGRELLRRLGRRGCGRHSRGRTGWAWQWQGGCAGCSHARVACPLLSTHARLQKCLLQPQCLSSDHHIPLQYAGPPFAMFMFNWVWNVLGYLVSGCFQCGFDACSQLHRAGCRA